MITKINNIKSIITWSKSKNSIIEINLNKKANIKYLNSGHNQFDMSFNINYLMNFMPNFSPTFIEEGIKKYLSKL